MEMPRWRDRAARDAPAAGDCVVKIFPSKSALGDLSFYHPVIKGKYFFIFLVVHYLASFCLSLFDPFLSAR
jgi:hypothetical protein